MPSLRVAGKLLLIVLASVVLMPLQWMLVRCTRGRAAFVLPSWWYGCLRRALGIRVEMVGTPRTDGGTLFVSNHISHYDIPTLGSLLRARFIAKDDMARWPGMGAIGGLGQTLFISRRPRDAADVAASVAAQLQSGDDVVLFAEGTTSSGAQVAPFKSSLFALFLGPRATGTWTLQPVTLDIVSVDGHALDDGGDRDAYAFYGDMDAGAHVLRFLRMSGAVVRVTFHAPFALREDTDRKVLANQVHAIVVSGLRRRSGARAHDIDNDAN